MPIGNSPDLPEYDKEREMEQRLIDKVYLWWDSLDNEDQHKLILDYYPNTFTENDNANDFFDNLINDGKLWIWERENNLTEEDLQGQRDMAGDLEYERRRIEGDNVQ